MDTQSRKKEIADLIDRTIHDEAGRNEIKLAWMRATVITISAAMDLFFFFNPRAVINKDVLPPTIFILSVTWAFLAIGLLLYLKSGRYKQWMRTAIPIFDGVMVTLVFLNLWKVLAPEQPKIPAVMINLSAAAILLAVTGGLRLTKGSAAITTGIAYVVFMVIAVVTSIDMGMALFVVVILFGAGILVSWMTAVLRRQVAGEVGRLMLERFLPRKVVVEAHENPMALLTEPRSQDVTVVVTDLRGFTAMSEKMSPAEVLEFLNIVQGALADIVRDHQGTVDKFMGDGMLAVFGAPEPAEDHAALALRAAKRMQEAVETISKERATKGLDPVRLGVGIHSGPAVVGCLGSGLRMEFTVIGDTVNASSRLESMTKEKGVPVLVSVETARRAGSGAPSLKSMGEVAIRGRQEPLEVLSFS